MVWHFGLRVGKFVAGNLLWVGDGGWNMDAKVSKCFFFFFIYIYMHLLSLIILKEKEKEGQRR